MPTYLLKEASSVQKPLNINDIGPVVTTPATTDNTVLAFENCNP